MQDCSSGKIINSLFFLLRIYGFRFLVTSSRCQAKSKFLLTLLSSNKMKEDVFLPTTLPTSIKFPLILLKTFAKIAKNRTFDFAKIRESRASASGSTSIRRCTRARAKRCHSLAPPGKSSPGETTHTSRRRRRP